MADDSLAQKRKWTIYTLSDPRDGAVRYVGVTFTRDRRFMAHIQDAKRGKKSLKCDWLRSLLDLGLQPIQQVVEEANDTNWGISEQKWIAHYRALGPLTNIGAGGEGSFVRRPVTPEYRAKLSAAMKGKEFSPEHRANIAISAKKRGMPPSTEERRAKQAAALKDRPWSEARRAAEDCHPPGWASKRKPSSEWKRRPPVTEEWREKMRAAHLGKKASEETREKMRAARREVSCETREKLRAARLGQKMSEESRDKLRAYHLRKKMLPAELTK
jgi:hypothetical protein